MSKTRPNPGSETAVHLGCTCPVEDNNNGAGIELNGTVTFWYDDNCPLHANDGLDEPGPHPPMPDWVGEKAMARDSTSQSDASDPQVENSTTQSDASDSPADCRQAFNPACHEITRVEVQRLRGADRRFAADIYDKRLRMLEYNTRNAFIEMGLICLAVTEQELWKELALPETGETYHSRDAWMTSALNVSRSSAYSAMKVLQMEIGEADLREMPRRNAERLVGLSSAVQRDPEMVEKAKTVSERELVAEVQKKYPDQHIEGRRQAVAKLDDSARKVMDETFEMVRWAYDVESRQDIFEQLFAYFLEGPCERENYTEHNNQRLTNREAFRLARERGLV